MSNYIKNVLLDGDTLDNSVPTPKTCNPVVVEVTNRHVSEVTTIIEEGGEIHPQSDTEIFV